jgi:hypothetical protein
VNNWELMQALVFEPRKAFTEIAARPRWFLPLLLVIVATVGTQVWYMSVVDLAWFTDQQLHQAGGARKVSEEQIAQLSRAAAGRNGIVATMYGIGYTLLILIATLLMSLYYLLAGKITNVQRSFGQWFALTCWTSLPTVLNLIPAAIVLLSATSNQIPPESLQPLSLNALFFHRAAGDPGYAVLAGISVLQLLSVILAVLGIKIWSGRSWLYAIIFWLIPVAVIWALVAGATLGARGGA